MAHLGMAAKKKRLTQQHCASSLPFAGLIQLTGFRPGSKGLISACSQKKQAPPAYDVTIGQAASRYNHEASALDDKTFDLAHLLRRRN